MRDEPGTVLKYNPRGDDPLLIDPEPANQRMAAQHGMFLMCREPGVPSSRTALVRFRLPAASKSAVEAGLILVGVTAETLKLR